MEPSLEVTITGTPVPKGRPRARIRFTGKGPKVEMYTPEKTRDWETVVEQHIRRERKLRPPLEGRLIAHATFWLPRPKTVKDAYPTNTRADIDNLVKALLDGAQNGGAFVNDGQITDITASKRYAEGSAGALLQLWEAS